MKTVPLFNESVILQEVAQGNERAFTMLFRQYSSKVYSFALKLTRSEEIAEEVVQEVFMKIWLNRAGLPEIREFGAYLNRVNKNHCLNVIKRLASETRIHHEISRGSTEFSLETEQHIAYRATQELLDQAIGKLTPQQQKVYRLCHIDGLKYEEAAGQLNISPGTVHSHMKQALKLIRSHLEHAGAAMLVATLIERYL